MVTSEKIMKITMKKENVKKMKKDYKRLHLISEKRENQMENSN